MYIQLLGSGGLLGSNYQPSLLVRLPFCCLQPLVFIACGLFIRVAIRVAQQLPRCLQTTAVRKMARTPFMWDAGALVVLGPFSRADVECASAIANGWISLENIYPLPATALRLLMSEYRMSLRALVYFFLADRSFNDRRARFQRAALEELGYIVVYRL